MIKKSIQQEDITFVNIYTPNVGAPKANINRPKGRNRQQYNNSRGLQYPVFINGYITQTENLQGNIGLK